MAAAVQNGDTVKVHYTGRLTDGTVFDSSREGDPIQFTLGGGEIIAGFEAGVIGMEPGEIKTIDIPSDEAYGPFFEEMVQEIERATIPAEVNLEIGSQLMARQPDGEAMVLTVVEFNDEKVTVDANHPLAGRDLQFDVELIAIV
jgi:peptidylprolyl isomerase